MTSDPFLSRWSKRKQAARSAEHGPNIAAPQPEPRASDAASEPGAPNPGSGATTPAEAELTPEEIAKLPSAEELTADTDISMFLRKGVPAALRNAALRRMWSLDPKIRDFIGDARDYAYDWNTPDGVPGNALLPSTEDVARMAARIVGGDGSAPPRHEARGDGASTPSQDREQHSPANAGASDMGAAAPLENPALLAKAEPPRREADEASALASPPSPDFADKREPAAHEMSPMDEPAKPASERRHGGAMPL